MNGGKKLSRVSVLVRRVKELLLVVAVVLEGSNEKDADAIMAFYA